VLFLLAFEFEENSFSATYYFTIAQTAGESITGVEASFAWGVLN
jgi:hypothetical protein